MAGIEELGSPNQSMGPANPNVKNPTIWLSGPVGYWNRVPQITQTTAIEVIAGRNNAPRKKFRAGIFWLISSAMASAKPHWIGTTMSVKNVTFHNARQNTGSLKTWT